MVVESFEKQTLHASEFLNVLAHPSRLMVLCALSTRELCVGELISITHLSQSALSQHLVKLGDKGFVTMRRKAQVIYYQLANKDCIKVIETLQQIFCPK